MSVNIEQDAADLRKAMKGMGTDEDAIIKIVANRTNAQSQKIKESYNKQFNRDIIKDLKSELRGKLEDIVIALFQTPVEYDCDQLKKAMKGSGTDESTLIEIIATRPNSYIQQMHKQYREMFGKELVSDIMGEISGELKDLLLSLLQGARDDSYNVDPTVCAQKAQELYKAGEGKVGTNDKLLMRILISRDEIDMPQIKEAYNKLYGKDMVNDIKNDLSGDYKKMMIELCSH